MTSPSCSVEETAESSAFGELDADLEVTGMTAVHNGGLAGVTGPAEQARRVFDGALCRRQADALRSPVESGGGRGVRG